MITYCSDGFGPNDIRGLANEQDRPRGDCCRRPDPRRRYIVGCGPFFRSQPNLRPIARLAPLLGLGTDVDQCEEPG
jgi:hypothetical protein